MALYTTVNTTDTRTGQSIMVLVPSVDSDVPYAGAPTRVVLYARGVGEDQTALTADSLKSGVITSLLTEGYILAGTNAHGGWPTQTAVDDYAALDQYVRANYNVENVCIWSQSMGGLSGLLAVAQGKCKAIGWLGTYPLCSLLAANTGDGGSDFSSNIATAFGITGSGISTYSNLTYGQDPLLLPAMAYAHIPMRLYASSGDTTVGKAANTDAFAALCAGTRREAEVVVCSGNHGDASHFQPSDYLAFFERCFNTPVAQRRPTSTRTLTVTVSDGSVARPGLSGLSWSWWDESTPGAKEYPTDQGTGETTNGSGVLAITVHTSLASGARGWLEISDSDGTATQSPAAIVFSGPVVLD